MNETVQIRFFDSHSDNLKSKIENLKWLGLFVLLMGCVGMAEAQQPKKVPRIGYLAANDPARESTRSEAIRLALRELGHIDGQNIAIEYRYSEGRPDRYPALAAELVGLKVDVIVVTGGDPPIQAAKNATKTIPIVMAGSGSDPVEVGHVESLARPGGNVTGVTNLGTELGGKRLELLKEVVLKSCPCRGSLQSGLSVRCTRDERSSPGRGACAGVESSALGGTRHGRFR